MTIRELRSLIHETLCPRCNKEGGVPGFMPQTVYPCPACEADEASPKEKKRQTTDTDVYKIVSNVIQVYKTFGPDTYYLRKRLSSVVPNWYEETFDMDKMGDALNKYIDANYPDYGPHSREELFDYMYMAYADEADNVMHRS